MGPDVDLEAEGVRLAYGSRPTEHKEAGIVDEVRRRGGRPWLTGAAPISPRIAFRVTPTVRDRDRALELAAREGKTISQLAREALQGRLAASDRR